MNKDLENKDQGETRRKSELRKEILAQRNKVSPVDKILASRAVLYSLGQMPEFQKANRLLLYVSYGSELPTEEIFSAAIWQEKEVYVPKVLSPGHMEFYRITSYEQLIDGYQGILEPVGDTERYIVNASTPKDLILVPGSVFDKKGNRIGYGKGFYDRYLTGLPIQKCGICYDLQLVDEILAEPGDVPMDFLVTEKKIIENTHFI